MVFVLLSCYISRYWLALCSIKGAILDIYIWWIIKMRKSFSDSSTYISLMFEMNVLISMKIEFSMIFITFIEFELFFLFKENSNRLRDADMNRKHSSNIFICKNISFLCNCLYNFWKIVNKRIKIPSFISYIPIFHYLHT